MKNADSTYEEKAIRLDAILKRLDNSETPIDQLAEDVKEGVRLIREMSETLRKVEMEVKDAFRELEELEKAAATRGGIGEGELPGS
ncbi:MAG: exodeoxyribonuclease VII small subunit [Bacteroidota bacterium]|nr:exodeoxyribonuclease VII small subunit [Bacteroidota bacterium]